jgi:hypothetical protein
MPLHKDPGFLLCSNCALYAPGQSFKGTMSNASHQREAGPRGVLQAAGHTWGGNKLCISIPGRFMVASPVSEVALASDCRDLISYLLQLESRCWNTKLLLAPHAFGASQVVVEVMTVVLFGDGGFSLNRPMGKPQELQLQVLPPSD